ncbi:MAG: Rrf2 family transcriptional regulator [Algoriphagus sp.]|uniref:RrF2 family transcriptional regulator n=1 Tax=Algoriphagus sp. TaxID=1872435 RepID=UPI002731545B|nr:Rrf2 family transcriptional regulator [Algoriphagus sp.]MDP2043520.1 Rrf2 family transcriptional regulator [Algoriphagus sp.]MDP3472452.1 Rrf2 family transcriptional regulator [Algoriphagus sp.]
MFSKACKYAINSMIFLATMPEGEECIGLKEIAVAINSPEAFTAKILQTLVREHLLESIKGPNGGFRISESGRKVSLHRVVEVVDGDSIFTGCALGLQECSEKRPCAVHHKFKAIRDHLTGMMMTTTLEDMAKGIQQGVSYLKY